MNPLIWYENPLWYVVGLSIVGHIVTFHSMSRLKLKEKHATEIERLKEKQRQVDSAVEAGMALVDAIQNSNDAFMASGAFSPIAFACGISKSERASYAEFSTKAVMFYNQLQLLRVVFKYRHALPQYDLFTYEKWATDIVKPWISQDNDLKKVWKHTVVFEKFKEHGKDEFGAFALKLWPIDELDPK